MAEVVAEGNCLGQVLVEAKRARHGASNTRDLERVGEACAEVVALGRNKHLRLVLQATERLGVHDAIAIALERRAQATRLLGVGTPERIRRPRRPRSKACVLLAEHPLEKAIGDGAGQRLIALRRGKVGHTT